MKQQLSTSLLILIVLCGLFATSHAASRPAHAQAATETATQAPTETAVPVSTEDSTATPAATVESSAAPTAISTANASSAAPKVLWQVQAAASLDNPKGIPSGIAVGSDGVIYVADTQLGVRSFSPEGKELPKIKGLPVNQVIPSDIVVSKGGLCMSLPELPDGAVGCFANGKLTLLTGTHFNMGSPRSIAINGKGEIFALDVQKLVEQPMSKVSVVHFDETGKFVGSFVALSDKQLDGVGTVRIAAPFVGGVFVVTDGPQGIYSYSYNGELIKQGIGDQAITDLKPTAMAFGPQEQTAVAGKKGQIVYNPGDGNLIKFGRKAAAQGELKRGTFYAPIAMAISADNRLYIIDQNDDHTQIVAVQMPGAQK